MRLRENRAFYKNALGESKYNRPDRLALAPFFNGLAHVGSRADGIEPKLSARQIRLSDPQPAP
jgi:hypothetical protein